jgi:hypothetical protein
MPELSPEDYYLENGRMVFTAAYHLKRGHCCRSGCRHCPYGFVREPAEGAAKNLEPALSRVAAGEGDGEPITGFEAALPGRVSAVSGFVNRDPVTVDAETLERLLNIYSAHGGPFPKKRRLRAGALLFIRGAMEPGREYSAHDVFSLIRAHTPAGTEDVTVRVYLIEFGMLERFPDGSVYWAGDAFRGFVSIPPEVSDRLPDWSLRAREACARRGTLW